MVHMDLVRRAFLTSFGKRKGPIQCSSGLTEKTTREWNEEEERSGYGVVGMDHGVWRTWIRSMRF
jgi:hypothetical protein